MIDTMCINNGHASKHKSCFHCGYVAALIENSTTENTTSSLDLSHVESEAHFPLTMQ